MFNWFGKKGKDNVVPFPKEYGLPEPDETPPVPEVKKPTVVYYRLGITDNRRVSLQIGYSEITMSSEGVQNLIDQLTLFMNQLPEDDYDNAS